MPSELVHCSRLLAHDFSHDGRAAGSRRGRANRLLAPVDRGDDQVRPHPPLARLTLGRPFDALLKSYQQLADLVLYSLRVEVRLRTMHFLDKATRDGVYQLSEDIAEPDSSVVDLNSALAECDECAATTLAGPERRCVPASWLEQTLILGQVHLRRSLSPDGPSPHLQLSLHPTCERARSGQNEPQHPCTTAESQEHRGRAPRGQL